MKDLDLSGAVDLSDLGIKRTTTQIGPEFLARKHHMDPKQYYLMLCDEAIGSNIITAPFFRSFTDRMLHTRKLPLTQVTSMMEQIILRKIGKIRHDSWYNEGNIIANADTTFDEALKHGVTQKNSKKRRRS